MNTLASPLSEYLPVLSVVLLDPSENLQSVLVGIRSEDVNLNHPNVVSVPTMRLPLQLAYSILHALNRDHSSLPTSICNAGTAHDPVGYAVWSLLAAKVGLADAIERGHFDLSVLDGCILQGESLIDYIAGQDVNERLTMINLLCVIRRGRHAVPASNAVFSRFSWLEYSLLVDAATSKDLSALSHEYQSLEVCIHGLCIRTAVSLYPAWCTHRDTHMIDRLLP